MNGFSWFNSSNIDLKENLTAYSFIFPFILIVTVWLIYPIIYAFILSLSEVTLTTDFFNTFEDMRWVGLENYARLIYDVDFWWSILMTLYYAVLYLPGYIIFSLILAIILNNQLPGKSFFRGVFFLPYVLDLLVIGIIWTLIYAPNYGLLALLFQGLGLESWADFGVLGNPWTALPGIALAMILKTTGYGMVIYLTAIQNISPSIYEAAELDGAGWWDQLRYITWPLVKPVTLFLSVTGFMMVLNGFTVIYAMSETGGPSISLGEQAVGATRITGFYLYQIFHQGEYGYAAAVCYALLVLAIIVSIINFKYIGTGYENE